MYENNVGIGNRKTKETQLLATSGNEIIIFFG